MSKKKYKEPETLHLLNEPSPEFIIQSVRKGIFINTFLQGIPKSAFNLKEWANLLHISERTIQRYEALKKHFEPLHSERIIELQRLNLQGAQVLGNATAFKTWLHTQCIALGGVTPFSLLDSSIGIHMVMQELGRIEHGIYS
jgi:putative toxin-antitoxin system antitoxin component (TIGR02293 family)